ncbi:ATP-binding protein [Legionella pneumophila serogroup 1]|uniref:AAA family ATPase n=1 Tax=Legionella pneumophila TaxID=446 RepID=UPI0007707FF0|nr:ATP-binding protein [Legionella pneumophila]HAT8832002.1 AAA family ATPase [Legionella pneumophila subsp. pneumophila]QIB25582.1 ATP-binding protein [Legionella pneumophila]CZH10227.1 Predicted ATPase (AAA+ superfamily) [Legionella pneumophila]CZH38730.1 Predicted ATPase (AAA+ superfamily) [Legionella pneumophila]HAT1965422.1 ATP-binding protein [Legionella pneumophila]
MNPIKNPFSPGAGSPPPELVGREEILSQSNILLQRILKKRSEKSFLLTGLRGVGKTVLLNEIERQAETAGYKTILIEAHEGKSLGALLIPHLKRLLFDLDRLSGVGDKVRRGLGVLKSFISTIKIKVGDVEFGLGIDPELGAADSGDIEVDLPNLFVALAEAAEERGAAVAILIDEIQYFSINEISALIMAMHKMQQKRLPLILIGAGLPILPALAGDSKSYAERLFQFPNIGPLSEVDANKALQDPVNEVDVEFTVEALKEIYELTKGYPYFLQEWGYQSWNYAKDSPIDLQDVKDATSLVIRRLDENFFRVRFDRLTPSEQNYLRGMAEIGAGPKRTGDIAEILGKSVSSLGPVRDRLIKKGMIYSPSHGEMAFTVPLFDEYMKRIIPTFNKS